METNLQRKMGGWTVELIAPGLIMLMTGSLAFFLVELFYYGATESRVKWVLGLFVFASVLVSRISISDGYEKAILYGTLLGGASLFVLSVLTEVPLILSIFFIGIIWWFNSKLTWDCTVIDHSKDSTDQGLLQRLGVASDQLSEEEPIDDMEPDELGTSDPEDKENLEKDQAWTQRFFSRKRRPNTPGVWVLYLSLAAFPIFGIGQGFISDLSRRENAFIDFCLYMVGGLGLLVTTALMGLQRYLARRNATMPNGVAVSWIGLGIAMIAGILITGWLLPRPYAEYSIAENPFKWTRQSSWQSSRNPIGSDGKKSENSGGQDQRQPNKQESNKQTGSSQGGNQGKQGSQSQSKQPSSSKSKSSGKREAKTKSSGKIAAKKNNESGKSPANKKTTSGNDQTNPKGKQQSRNQSENKTEKSDEKASEAKSRSPESKKSGNKNQQPSTGKQKRNKSSKNGSQTSDKSETNSKSDDPDKAKKEQRNSGSGPENNNSPQRNGAQKSGSADPKRNSFRMPTIGNITWFFQILFWLAIILAASYFAWRNRQKLLASWRQLIEDIRNFWEKLFRKQKPANTRAEQRRSTESESSKPARPFSTFNDPFQNNSFREMSQVELIRYSFEALEAWGRDHSITREDNQTPHEYVMELVKQEQSVAKSAKPLADYYCAAAFSRDANIDQSVPSDLKKLWEKLSQSQKATPHPAS